MQCSPQRDCSIEYSQSGGEVLSIAEQHAKRSTLFTFASLVLVLDQASKFVVAREFPLHQGVKIIPGLFDITYVINQGAAFGLFSDSPSVWKTGLLILFSLLALMVVSTLLWRNSHALSAAGVALSLILGGALGNLADRLLQGHVVDFLDFYYDGYHWPAFNIADSAIVIGATLLVAKVLFSKAPAEEHAAVIK